MWDLKACRCCLATQTKLEKVSETLRRLYGSVTGLEFKAGDGYPNYFCVECHCYLKKCLAFRRKTRRAHFVLQGIMNSKKQITVNDILQVNRQKTNLISSVGFSEPDRQHCYDAVYEGIDVNVKSENNAPTISLTIKDFYNQIIDSETKIVKRIEDIKPNLTSQNYLVYRKPTCEQNAYRIVEIKSDQQLADEEAEQSQQLMEEQSVKKEENVSKIDLDDVFKDLNDETNNNNSNDEDYDADADWTIPAPEPELEPKKTMKQLALERKQQKQKVKFEQQLKLERSKQVTETIKILNDCILIPQSLEQMKQNLQERMQSELYTKARLKCVICVTVYGTVSELMEHVKFHNRPNSALKCKACLMRMTTEDELIQHEFEDHDYLYHCQLCEKVIYTLGDYKLHHKLSHPDSEVYSKKKYPNRYSMEELDELYKITLCTLDEMYNSLKDFDIKTDHVCQLCNMGFRQESALYKHIRRHNKIASDAVQCDVCKIWCQCKSSMDRHINNFHRYKYSCRKCDKVVYTRTEASYHRLKHVGIYKETEEALKCPDCDKTFNYQGALKLHRLNSHYSEEFRFHCISCGNSFSTKMSLYFHQMGQHKRIILPSAFIGEEQFKCLHCDIKFMNEEAYKKHVVKHRHPEANDIPLACPPCRKLFTNEEEFDNHRRSTYCKGPKREYPKQCFYCPAMLESPRLGSVHISKMHRGMIAHKVCSEKMYTLCEQCGQSVHSNRMSEHVKRHTAAPTSCPHCSSTFSAPTSTYFHIIQRHSVRPFRCGLCPAAYKLRGDARDHILKAHAPVRPYSCKWCPLKFSHLDYLNEHTSKIHDAEPQKLRPMKSKGRVFTYAHMRVDISNIPEEVLSQLKFEICDYHDKNATVLQDYTKFFLRNPPPLQCEETPRAKRKRKVKNTDPQNKRAKMEEPKMEIVISSQDTEIQDTEIQDTEIQDTVIQDTEVQDTEIQDDNYDDFKEEYVTFDPLDEDDTGDITLDPDTNYEVIEQDGEQFVMINNALYKIEADA